MKGFFTLSFLLFTLLATSQEISPVTWSFDVENVDGDEYNLIFTADIDAGWNVYSQYIEEGGPVATEIVYESEKVNTIGKAEESGYKKEGMDAIFDMHMIKFLDKEPYVITQKIKKGDSDKISGYITFMCCDDKKCLAPTDIDFSFDLAKANTSAPHKKDRAAVSTPSKTAEFEKIKNSALAASEKIIAQKKTAVVKTPQETTRKLANTKPSQIQWVLAEEENARVKWYYGLETLANGNYRLSFKADIDKGWTVYSQFVEDGGPIATEIVYEQPEGLKNIGQSTEEGYRKEGVDPYFDINVIKFLDSKPYVITQEISSDIDANKISGYITYMACDDTKCLPPTDIPFAFDISQEKAIPVGSEIADTNNITEETASLGGAILVGNVIDQSRPKLQETHAEPLTNCGEEAESRTSMMWMFIFGFLGGLVALLTPCVFPIIPMTVSFFTKDTKRKGWVSGLIYGASIVVIYVTIGLLITALFGEEALNSLSTNWIANTLFFLIFVFFAFSFFGFYEITLPSSWSTNSDKMADKGGVLGIFFMAFTLALVSFSCTGPIIGAALVESATSKIGPFVVMLGFSLGLAIPFGLFAAFPAWLNSLPQSGGWMNSVKVVLGFVELALAFKFLTVADLTSHWGLLKYETFIGIWILIALAMAAYGMGWLKFPHDSPIKKRSTRRYAFSLLSLLFAGYLATGFIYNDEIKSYNPLLLMSGIAPPVSYNLFLDDPKDDLDKDIKSKYPSFSKCANNIDCFKDYFEGMAYAKEVGKPVFLDHTGHGCVNCRRTEDNIWSDDRIRRMLSDDYVLVSLYVDDREKLEQTLISESRQTKLRTVGSRWADFEIVNFAEFSQPLYVMLTPQEEVVTKPRGYKEGIEDYYDYLRCGLETFKSVSMK